MSKKKKLAARNIFMKKVKTQRRGLNVKLQIFTQCINLQFLMKQEDLLTGIQGPEIK